MPAIVDLQAAGKLKAAIAWAVFALLRKLSFLECEKSQRAVAPFRFSRRAEADWPSGTETPRHRGAGRLRRYCPLPCAPGIALG
jgi:hypothetical protein